MITNFKSLIVFIAFALAPLRGFAQLSCGTDDVSSFGDLAPLASFLDQQYLSVQLDPSLLRPWTIEARLPCTPPFKATYRKDEKEVVFVAVEHTSGPVSNDDPAFKMISALIEKEKPEGVLVETVSGGVMPPGALRWITENCYRDSKFFCGEAAYAAVMAGKNGAEVQGGEPVPSLLNDEILKTQSKINLLAYRSTQTVLTLKREGVPESEWAKKFLENLRRDSIPTEESWTYSRYTDWIRENLNSQPEQVEDHWIEPRADQSSSPLQKVAFNIGLSREPLILRTAEKVINKHNKTVIFYGAGHFYKQSLAFEKVLGVPRIECLGTKN